MINSLNKHLLQLNIPKITIPALLKFRISFCFQKYGDIFDFNSCTKLKYFIRLNLYYFFQLGETLLEKVYLNNNYIDSEEKEIKIFQKIMEMKTLKELKIDLLYFSENNLNK